MALSMPATAATITPFEAAVQLRMLVRDIQNRSADAAYGAVMTERWFEETNLNSLKSAKKFREALPELRKLIQREREYMVAGIIVTNAEATRMYDLVQHLPTVEDLPKANAAETTIRAIRALLKHSGVPEEGNENGAQGNQE